MPLAELAWWLQEMHGLTGSEIRDLVVDLRSVSLWFRVLDGSAAEDKNLKSWNGLEVDWEAGRARCKQDPDSIYFPLVVSWGAVTDAVTRLRMRRKRLAMQAPASGPAEAAGEAKTKAANAADPVITRTGAQGHPSSMANLVAPELARRAAAGETLSTMKEEAVTLSKWLANQHPKQPQAKPRAIENALRDKLRTAINAAKERGI